MRTCALAVLAVATAVASAGTARAGSELTGLASFRHTAFERDLAQALAVPGVSRRRTGALAFDLRSRRVVYALNPRLPLAPASNEKLPVTFTALLRLGAGYRFRTEVLGVGHRRGDVWHGRLYLHGGGDPTLHVSGLRRLARVLRDAGIRRVTGDVLADESFFDSRRTAPGWKPSFYMDESPPLSALVVARARFDRRMTPDPAGAAAAIFVRQLDRLGIRVGGESAWGTAPRGARLLAQTASQPLSQILRFMDRRSDNFTAEMVLKTLGAAVTGHGMTAVGARVVVDTLASEEIPLDGVRIADGSGLSPRDRLTPRAIAAILLAGWSDPRVRPWLWRALAVAGRSGTLADRLRGTAADGVVRAKTGTTNGASALSGFAGRRYAFVVVQDGDPVATWSARAAQDAFATVLARAARRH